ncbi:hypothetical protein O181_034149 [Austropuccinia psidii MF-1]|uniref:Low temperature viability protein n=1 Tax=Austropuccinia psidii MF-1 TaxID=1389203 RepID=A0A9Q3D0C8_9BASI|nr:hypothetical protein [Austropuccinia psidii MF-1]
MAQKSIFRGPNVKHFAVLHRSQRDPLINDPEAGDRVLHEIQRQNDLKSKKSGPKAQTLDQLEADLGLGSSNSRSNVGEAALYNVFYDDSEYDYMQHLRQVGLSREAVFIEKPTLKKEKRHQTDAGDPITLKNPDGFHLPQSVQPTPVDQTLTYKDHLEFALPQNSLLNEGLFPVSDDPALQEILVALDDEAYVEEEADDAYFGNILKDGERDESDKPNWIKDVQLPSQAPTEWESTVGRFKASLSNKNEPDQFETTSIGSLSTPQNEFQDLISSRSIQFRHPSGRSVPGSNFSMSSSAMFRNEGLTTLDERFDKIAKEYESSSDDDDDDDASSCHSDLTATPAHIRQDFDDIMDDFLNRFEVLGGKMKPRLAGETPSEKLKTMRSELLAPQRADELERQLIKEKILSRMKQDEKVQSKPGFDTIQYQEDEPRDRWDCQTILSTYSNLENHPRIVSIRDTLGPSAKPTKPAPQKIEIDRLTGFPMVNGKIVKGNEANQDTIDEAENDTGSDSDMESAASVRQTVKRDRGEDKEMKKARKNEVKLQRAARRQAKKSTKEAFTGERKKQQKLNEQQLAKKAIDIAGMGGKGVISLM